MSPDAALGAEELAADDHALRHGAAVVPIACDVVRVRGADAIDFLQGQCSQDVAALAVGASGDALVLTPQGKLDALVRITRVGEDDVLVDVDGGWGQAVATRLQRFKIRVKATVELTDWTCVALRGPAALASAEAAGLVVSTTGRPNEATGTQCLAFEWGPVSGIDILGPSPKAPAGVRLCSAPAWAAIRIEAGIPVMGAELDERTIAAEADLLERCVSFTKGCYTGQELVARLDARGNRVARHLCGVVAEQSSVPDDGLSFVPGAAVFGADADGSKTIGTVTSAAYSIARGRTVALAYLHRDVTPPAAVDVVDPSGSRRRAEAKNLPIGA